MSGSSDMVGAGVDRQLWPQPSARDLLARAPFAIMTKSPMLTSAEVADSNAVADESERQSEKKRDIALARRAIAGERKAQEEIYHLYRPYLFSLASRLLSSREAAGDVVQDSFVRAIERFHTLRDPAALKAWLCQILVNRARNVLKRERFRRRLGLTTVIPETDYVPPPDYALDGRLAWHDLSHVLRRTPPDARIAWWLQRVERYTVREVAEMTGSTVDKVKKRLVAAERQIDLYRNVEAKG